MTVFPLMTNDFGYLFMGLESYMFFEKCLFRSFSLNIDQNLAKAETIRFLEENTGINFYDFGFGKRFLAMTPKS
jgi:hypothetical protein